MVYYVGTTAPDYGSTDWSTDVPTAATITQTGTVSVWYYVQGDDTHSDTDVNATALTVTIADAPSYEMVTLTDGQDITALKSWGQVA